MGELMILVLMTSASNKDLGESWHIHRLTLRECSGSKPSSYGFEPLWRHCVVSLSKTHYSSLSTGSSQEDCPDISEKLLTGRLRIGSNNQKQTHSESVNIGRLSRAHAVCIHKVWM